MASFKEYLVLVCVFISLDCCVYACLSDPSIEFFVSGRETSTTINATLGEGLNIICSVNKLSNLSHIDIYSRVLGELSTTCNVSQASHECLFKIQKVDYKYQGLYDCIAHYKDMTCSTKAIKLAVVTRLKPTATKTIKPPVTTSDEPTWPPSTKEVLIIETMTTTPHSGSITKMPYMANVLLTFLLLFIT